MEDVLGGRIVTRRVVCLGIEKIRVVGQLPIGPPRLCQSGFRFGEARVEQVRVAQGQVGGRRSLTRVAVCVGSHRRIGFRRAHGRQLQLF